jgi:hypothetical protein
MRSKKDIREEEDKFYNLLWYQRQLVRVQEERAHPYDEEKRIPLQGISAMEQIEATYPAEDLKPASDYELAMLEGKLSALRWVLEMRTERRVVRADAASSDVLQFVRGMIRKP